MTDLKISVVKFNGYKIELTENMKGKPVAKLYKTIAVGRYKGEIRLVEGFYFLTEERRQEWVMKKIAEVKAWETQKQNRKNQKSEARKNMVNPFKVGQILYDSWGYDQTNIDFYKVIEVKPKSVVIVEIGGKFVEGTQGRDCSNVKPDPDKIVGKPIVKPVIVNAGYDGKISYYIKSKHGWISEYDRGDKGVYSSWYA